MSCLAYGVFGRASCLEFSTRSILFEHWLEATKTIHVSKGGGEVSLFQGEEVSGVGSLTSLFAVLADHLRVLHRSE